jgi:glycosyltransferase involved in cell wall biosynthesis
MIETTKENHPLITVITVVFNGEETIESTINSVINFREKYKNVEYIIIDGNSTDQTKAILSRYDKAINYWISESDKGIYDAMNKGWNKAKESYILFLGSGDKILEFPEKISLINDEKKKVYYGNVCIGKTPFYSHMSWKFKAGNTFHHQALLIPKNSCYSSPFNIEYKVYADYEFNIRLHKQEFIFIYLDNFKSFALPGGLSSKVHLSEIITIVKRNFGYFWAMSAICYHTQNILKKKLLNRFQEF